MSEKLPPCSNCKRNDKRGERAAQICEGCLTSAHFINFMPKTGAKAALDAAKERK